MASLGYRQPYWIADDRCTVMMRVDGRQTVEWVAPSFEQALMYVQAANAEFQIAVYGWVDPRAGELKRAAQTFGMN
jgi:6-phosphogluconolactonase (cycloisomerase 2 family)